MLNVRQILVSTRPRAALMVCLVAAATGLVACLLGFLFVGSVNLASRLILRGWHESARGADL